MMKKIFLTAFLLSSAAVSADSLENLIKPRKFDLYHYFEQKKTAYLNWASLFYFTTHTRKLELTEKDNFVNKTFFAQNNFVKEVRSRFIADILKTDINNEMTVKELLDLSEAFKESLTTLMYQPELFLAPVQTASSVGLSAYIPFTGPKKLIDLILSCGFFIDQEPLTVIKTRYQASAFEKIIIEARHLSLKPSLFPQIFAIDEKGQEVLIYSLKHSNRKAIADNGYAKFYTNSKILDVENRKNFYCSALKLKGSKKTDVVISREDTIKIFGSAVTLKNLADGQLYFVVRKEK